MNDLVKKTADADADASVPVRRVGPVEFFQQVNRERKKVTWPSLRETYLTTIMVFIMVGVIMVFLMFVELGLSWARCGLIGVCG